MSFFVVPQRANGSRGGSGPYAAKPKTASAQRDSLTRGARIGLCWRRLMAAILANGRYWASNFAFLTSAPGGSETVNIESPGKGRFLTPTGR
jgi:hypothetical protein